MKKYIFDTNNDLWYELKSDYYLPCFTLPKSQEKEICIWGIRHLEFRKSYRKSTYSKLKFEDKLNIYLYNINSQAEEMFNALIEQFKKSEGITEQLKAQNQMQWVSKINNLQQRTTEIINNELIYD